MFFRSLLFHFNTSPEIECLFGVPSRRFDANEFIVTSENQKEHENNDALRFFDAEVNVLLVREKSPYHLLTS